MDPGQRSFDRPRVVDRRGQALANSLAAAADHPKVVSARSTADCSAELHRAAVLLELRLAGFDDELALAICERDGNVDATMPYTDTPAVLRDLKALGVRVGVISDIHYDLRSHFVYYGLDHLVDSYTLSFEHGVQKPDPCLFRIAVSALGRAPQVHADGRRQSASRPVARLRSVSRRSSCHLA